MNHITEGKIDIARAGRHVWNVTQLESDRYVSHGQIVEDPVSRWYHWTGLPAIRRGTYCAIGDVVRHTLGEAGR